MLRLLRKNIILRTLFILILGIIQGTYVVIGENNTANKSSTADPKFCSVRNKSGN